MKRLGLFLTAFLAITTLTPAHADLIKQSAAGYARTFLLTQSANALLGATGAAPVIKIRKAGGAYAATTNTATEVDSANDPGRYQVVLTSTEVNTLGLLDYAITGTGANPESAHDQVVGFDPSTDLGAATLATINTTTTGTGARVTTAVPNIAPGTSGGLLTYGTGAGQLNPVNGGLPGLTTALTGTATASTTTSITLAAGPAATDLIKGNYIAITGGTGAGQGRTITGWNGGTLVASIPATRPWIVTPDATSTYAVIINPHPAIDANLAIVASSVTSPVTVGTNSDKTGYTAVASNLPADYLTSGEQTSLTNAASSSAANGTAIAALPSASANGTAAASAILVTPAQKIGTNASNQVVASSVVSPVTAGTVTDKTGYALATAPPTPAQIASVILATPANLLATNGTGQVASSNLPADYLSTGEQTSLTAINTQTTAAQQQANMIAALVAQGYTVTRAAKLDNADVATSTRMAAGNVTVGAYSAGTSPDALVWNSAAATYNTAGSMGQKVNVAGTAGDPLTAAVPGSYGAGTAGAALGSIANLPTASSITTAVWGAGARTLTAQADTSGTTTLLSRLPGTVQPQTGDAYARLGAPVGASTSADIAAVQTASNTAATNATSAQTAANSANTTAGTINTKIGVPATSVSADIATRLAASSYTAPTTPPTTTQIASAILLTPANLLATDGSNRVTTANPSAGSSVTEATIWAYGTRTLTGQSDTPGTTTLLARIPGTVQPQTGDAFARLGAPVGVSTAADIASTQTAIGTRLASSAYITPLTPAQYAVSPAWWIAPATDYQQRGVAVTLPGTAPAGYGGGAAGPTVTQIRQEMDANSTVFASLVTGQASAATATAAIKAKTDQLLYDGSSFLNTHVKANDILTGYSAVATNLPTDYQQRAVAVTLPGTAPAGYGGSASDTSGVTTLLARIPGTVQPQTGDAFARLGAPTGASLAADVAAIPNACAASVLTAAVDGSITLKQALALNVAINTGKYSSAKNTGTGVVTTTYYRTDAATTLAVSVLTPSVGSTPATRTWTFSNLP